MTATASDKILMQARRLCQQRNVRLTPQRLQVLRLLSEQRKAISAYDLLDLLRVFEPRAKPPTIYRALDFLLEQGFIHRVESNNSYVVCHHVEKPQHLSAMLICEHCGSVSEKHARNIEKGLLKLTQQTGFQLHNGVIEAHGLCYHCCKKRKQAQG